MYKTTNNFGSRNYWYTHLIPFYFYFITFAVICEHNEDICSLLYVTCIIRHEVWGNRSDSCQIWNFVVIMKTIFLVNHWARNVESNSPLKMYIEHMKELSLAFIYYKGHRRTYYLHITWIGILPMRCIEMESTEGFTIYSLIAVLIHVTFSQVKENLLGVQWMHMYVNVCI